MTLNNKKEEKFKRMTPFTHPAQKIYQVDTGHQEQEPGVVLHDPGEGYRYQEPTSFRSGSIDL